MASQKLSRNFLHVRRLVLFEEATLVNNANRLYTWYGRVWQLYNARAFWEGDGSRGAALQHVCCISDG